jgi:hypothetical protein
MQKRVETGTPTIRPYHCKRCGGFHLSGHRKPSVAMHGDPLGRDLPWDEIRQRETPA